MTFPFADRLVCRLEFGDEVPAKGLQVALPLDAEGQLLHKVEIAIHSIIANPFKFLLSHTPR